MRFFSFFLLLALSTAVFADGAAPRGPQPSSSASVTLEIDPDVIVMDADEARQLMEGKELKPVQQAAASQAVAAPRLPETRVIELDPPPVAIVNRTNHFRIVSRRPAERPEVASETAEEPEEE
jgi:beta-lactam-binding protein with PASTA domain